MGVTFALAGFGRPPRYFHFHFSFKRPELYRLLLCAASGMALSRIVFDVNKLHCYAERNYAQETAPPF